jgi:hypothetical protein
LKWASPPPGSVVVVVLVTSSQPPPHCESVAFVQLIGDVHPAMASHGGHASGGPATR